MKKMYLFITIITSVLLYSQVGINTNSPTTTLDVNGNTRSRNLTGAVFNNRTLYPNSVVVTSADGTLTNINALNILYSSGIYRWSDTNNNWSNIRTGTKEAKLDFFGRATIPGNIFGISFSILYRVNTSITIIQNPVVSSGTVTISNITSNGLSLTISNGTNSDTFTIALTTASNGVTSVNITSTSGNWIQGTWHSLPNLN